MPPEASGRMHSLCFIVGSPKGVTLEYLAANSQLPGCELPGVWARYAPATREGLKQRAADGTHLESPGVHRNGKC